LIHREVAKAVDKVSDFCKCWGQRVVIAKTKSL
jgi:hypothetical protein